jgi:hypothetical protein
LRSPSSRPYVRSRSEVLSVPSKERSAYLLEPVGNVTVLTNTMTLQPSGPLRLVAPLAAPRVKAAVAANLDTLKQILETDGG